MCIRGLRIEGECLLDGRAGARIRVARAEHAVLAELEQADGETGPGGRVRSIALDGALEETDRPRHAFARVARQMMSSLEVELVGARVGGRLALEPAALIGRQLGLERARDVERDLRLDREDVGELAVVGLRPEVPVGCGVDELGDDPHAASGASDTAIHERADSES